MAKRTVHLRGGDLGMRPLRRDYLARLYRERWYSTLCGLEARSLDTSVIPVAPSRLWEPCQECVTARAAHTEVSDRG